MRTARGAPAGPGPARPVPHKDLSDAEADPGAAAGDERHAAPVGGERGDVRTEPDRPDAARPRPHAALTPGCRG